MQKVNPVVPARTPPVEGQNAQSSNVIDPLHILKAIENSLAYADDAPAGVTGISFERYRILVKKVKDFNWRIQCRFKKHRRPPERTRRRRN
jgi:hypothetical protein